MQSSRAHVAAQSPTLPRSHKHKGAVSRRRLSISKGLENDCCLRGSHCLHRDAADATESTDTVEATDEVDAAGGTGTADAADAADTAKVEDAAGAADAPDPGVLTLFFQMDHQSQLTV